MPNSQGGQYGPFTYTYSTDLRSSFAQGFGGQENPFGNFDFGDPFDIFESFGGGSPFGARREDLYPGIP